MDFYVSVDIEADGPIPSQNSMLSLGAAMLDYNYSLMPDAFHVNLLPRSDAVQDPDTMAWWAKNQKAYEEATKDAINPREAMRRFANWMNQSTLSLGFDKPRLTLVGYPITYDFMWVYDYTIRYLGRSPFSFSGLDIKTLMSAVGGMSYKDAVKSSLPKDFRKKLPKHTHKADEDAIEQALIFSWLMDCLKGKEQWTKK